VGLTNPHCNKKIVRKYQKGSRTCTASLDKRPELKLMDLRVKNVEFVSDRRSFLTLRCRWCDIVLNVHAPTEDNIDDVKDRRLFDKSTKYQVNIFIRSLTLFILVRHTSQ
jgi:hypothetical protein